MNMQTLRRPAVLLLGCLTLMWSGLASAEPPSRAARLGYISGTVSFSPAAQPDWVQAVVNRPLTTGDRLWADASSRAELQVGGAAIRLGADSSVTLLNLDDRIAQVQLSQGTLKIRVRHLAPGQTFEVDTPNLAFTLRRPGDYRIDVDPNDDATAVSVQSGEAEVYGEGASYAVTPRQSYRFYGTGLSDYDALPVRRDDDLDRWARDRDRRADMLAVGALRVAGSRRLRGSRCPWQLARRSDLRQRLDADPCRRRLDAVPRWPLGLGRSVGLDLGRRRALGLCRVALRPLGQHQRQLGLGARPAARTGGVCAGAGGIRRRQELAGLDLGGQRRAAAVGWFPLAPREVYQPSYPVSRGYFDNINRSNAVIAPTTITNVYNTTNVTNTTIVNNTTNIVKTVYVNQQVSGAVVAVPAQAFAQSQSVARAASAAVERSGAPRAGCARRHGRAGAAERAWRRAGGAGQAAGSRAGGRRAHGAAAAAGAFRRAAEASRHESGQAHRRSAARAIEARVVPGPAAKVSVIAAARAPAPAAAPPATAPAPKTPEARKADAARAQAVGGRPADDARVGRGTGRCGEGRCGQRRCRESRSGQGGGSEGGGDEGRRGQGQCSQSRRGQGRGRQGGGGQGRSGQERPKAGRRQTPPRQKRRRPKPLRQRPHSGRGCEGRRRKSGC